MYCQMHTTQAICLDSGMLAGPYCGNVSQRGVITIPAGHPLYKWFGTSYESVLEQYLGSSVTSTSTVCTFHHSGMSQPTDEGAAMFISDARRLLAQAETMLEHTDPYASGYDDLVQAVNILYAVIESNPTQDEVIQAMRQLTVAISRLNR